MKRASILLLVLAGACNDGSGRTSAVEPPTIDGVMPKPDTGDTPSPDGTPGAGAGSCSDLFRDDVLVTYEIDISAEEWALIHDEFVNFEARQAAGLDLNPYHPMTFHLGAEAAPAWIRLKGNSSWFSAVKKNPNVKKQFVIAFDQGADTKARFHGVQKIELDMPTLDRTFLHERLAQSFLHDVGVPSPCANSARLVVNGSYYGLYANLEFVNKDFLRRVFPDEADGDLWKKRSDLQTNQDVAGRDDRRHDLLWSSSDPNELAALMDMPACLRTWAAEALLPQPDGYWGGNSNFYVYDHPRRGFIWLTDDLDATFDFMPADMHPLYFWLNRTSWRGPGPHYVAVAGDPAWRDRFVEVLAQTVEGWNVEALQERVRRWSEQIADAIATDPNRSDTVERHLERQRVLNDFVALRPESVRRWIACYRSGGTDEDGDGSAWCLDCDDSSPAFHPGAPEVCGDGLDQDCDGLIDDGCN